MTKRKARNCWTYTEAQSLVKEIKPLLTALRESYIKWKHYVRLAKKDRTYRQDSKHWKVTAQANLNALVKLGVMIYEQPYHGVVLFPFKITVKTVKMESNKKKVVDKLVDAYFVYCDTKDLIENFVFSSTIMKKDKLRGGMKRIPDEWVNEQKPYRY